MADQVNLLDYAAVSGIYAKPASNWLNFDEIYPREKMAGKLVFQVHSICRF